MGSLRFFFSEHVKTMKMSTKIKTTINGIFAIFFFRTCENHENVNQNQNDYKWDLCDFFFRTCENHENVNQNQNDYKWDLCDFFFRTCENHENVNQNQNDYKWDLCDFFFSEHVKTMKMSTKIKTTINGIFAIFFFRTCENHENVNQNQNDYKWDLCDFFFSEHVKTMKMSTKIKTTINGIFAIFFFRTCENHENVNQNQNDYKWDLCDFFFRTCENHENVNQNQNDYKWDLCDFFFQNM